MDISAQWPHQDIGVVKPMNDHQEMVMNSTPMNTCSTRPTTTSTSTMLERKAISRPQKEQVLNCPRCNSTNTKFCYYNNYSLTQPRYFCKTCRRYWTEGGSLRNVPVGGGSRKNKRSSSSSSSTSSSPSSTSTTTTTITTTSSKKLFASTHDHQNPKIIEAQDLNLAYPIRHEYLDHQLNDPSPTSTTTTSSLSALELLRTGLSTNSSRGLINSFMPMPSTQQPHHDPNTTSVYSSSGFGLQDFKPTLNFGLDGLGSGGYGNSTTTTLQEVHDHNVNGRPISFPFEDLKQVSSTSHDDHHQFEQNRSGIVLQGSTTTATHDTNGYWNGMLSGGSW